MQSIGEDYKTVLDMFTFTSHFDDLVNYALFLLICCFALFNTFCCDKTPDGSHRASGIDGHVDAECSRARCRGRLLVNYMRGQPLYNDWNSPRGRTQYAHSTMRTRGSRVHLLDLWRSA